MAIKILRKGVPVVGFLKLGSNTVATQGKKSHPYKFDHVEITGKDRDKHGNLIPDVELMQQIVDTGHVKTCAGCARSKALGFQDGLPTQVPILIPYDDLELAFPNRLAYYRGRTAYCVGDGEIAQRLTVTGKRQNKGGGETMVYGPPADHGPCGSDCPDFEARRCKPNGKLRLVLGVRDTVGTVMEFRTTSWASIPNIQNGLEEIARATGGIIAGIPLMFEITEEAVRPKDGAPAGKAFIARVVPLVGRQELLQQASEMLRLREPLVREVRALEASISRDRIWDETPDEIEAHTREFYADGDASEVSAAEPEPAPAAETPDNPTTDEASASPPAEPDQQSLQLGNTDPPETPETPQLTPEQPPKQLIADNLKTILRNKAKARAIDIGLDGADASVIIECCLDVLGIAPAGDDMLGGVSVGDMNSFMDSISAYGARRGPT